MNREESKQRAALDMLQMLKAWHEEGVDLSEGISVAMSHLIGITFHSAPTKTTILAMVTGCFQKALEFHTEIEKGKENA